MGSILHVMVLHIVCGFAQKIKGPDDSDNQRTQSRSKHYNRSTAKLKAEHSNHKAELCLQCDVLDWCWAAETNAGHGAQYSLSKAYCSCKSTTQPRDCTTLIQTGSVPGTICCNSSSSTRSSDNRRSLCQEAEWGGISRVLRGFLGCCSGRPALGQHGAPVYEAVGGIRLQRAKYSCFFLQPITTMFSRS